MAKGHGDNGFLTSCRECRETIYMHFDLDDRWRAYESWVAGNAPEGEFILHRCRSAAEDAVVLDRYQRQSVEKLLADVERRLDELGGLVCILRARLTGNEPTYVDDDELPF